MAEELKAVLKERYQQEYQQFMAEQARKVHETIKQKHINLLVLRNMFLASIVSFMIHALCHGEDVQTMLVVSSKYG